jgi:hypothetical protein
MKRKPQGSSLTQAPSKALVWVTAMCSYGHVSVKFSEMRKPSTCDFIQQSKTNSR